VGGAAASGSGGSPSGGASGSGGGGAAGSGGTPAGGELPWLHVEGNQIKDPAGNTVVLRGVSTIDLGATDEWEGGAIEMIERLSNESDTQGSSPGWYPTVFRLAIYPPDSADFESPFTYSANSDDFYNQLLRPVVDHIEQKRAYAIIDWHYIGNTNQHVATTDEFWADMAPRFANDSHVLFELYNEPVNNGSWASVRTDMQRWYDIVHAAAPNNLVLIGTPSWCQRASETATNPITGGERNAVYVAHMYPIHWNDPELRNEVTTAAAAHPVFMSEWGFEQGSDEIVDGTISSYGSPFKQFVEQQGLSWTGWCASSSWFPPMFNDDYSLGVGEGRMGGFLKDWLYERRNDDLPLGL
jgi:endoglucanase